MSTALPEQTNTTVAVDPVLDTAPSKDDLDHFVCCREAAGNEPTLVTLCGKTGDREELAAVANQVCETCQQVNDSLLKLAIVNRRVTYKRTCIRNGSDCPTGKEADDLWKGILGMD